MVRKVREWRAFHRVRSDTSADFSDLGELACQSKSAHVELGGTVAVAVAFQKRLLALLARLRGYDAVHLATALELGDEEIVLVTWGRDLAQAAERVGLGVAGAGAAG